jgi:hypothetical protein
MIDLDLQSQRTAQSIAKECKAPSEILENVATKTLGVLQENGVYAAVLYTLTRTEKKQKPAAEAVRKGLLAMAPHLNLDPAPSGEDGTAMLRYLTEKVCNDLDRMLLVKQVWEQTLIYTRFGAKAEKHS